jgi:hypothetical protein
VLYVKAVGPRHRPLLLGREWAKSTFEAGEAVRLLGTSVHARNHAAFWDGAELTLTPAFDICPIPRAEGRSRG